MKFTTAFVAVAATLPALSHALFYNKTQAYQPGNFDKYSYETNLTKPAPNSTNTPYPAA